MAYCDEVDRPYLTVKEEEHDAPERTDEARDDEDGLLLRAVQHNADDEPHRNRGEDEAEHKDTGGKRVAGDLFFFSSRRRHTRSVSAFLLNRSSDLIKV